MYSIPFRITARLISQNTEKQMAVPCSMWRDDWDALYWAFVDDPREVFDAAGRSIPSSMDLWPGLLALANPALRLLRARAVTLTELRDRVEQHRDLLQRESGVELDRDAGRDDEHDVAVLAGSVAPSAAGSGCRAGGKFSLTL